MAIIEGRPATDFSDMNRKYIHDVAEEVAAGSGGGLPEITESDEGKVLTVEDGEAAWATGGGAPITILTPVCTHVSSPGGIKLTFQESFDEIVNLALSGLVFIKFYAGGEGWGENFIGYIYDVYQSTEDDVTTTEIKAWQPDSVSFESNMFEIYVDDNEAVAVLGYTG